MSYFKAKMHQIRSRLGLRTRPRTGELTALPQIPSLDLNGPTSKGRGGRTGQEEREGFFLIIFKHSWAPKRSRKICRGGPGKVLDFFVSKRVGTLERAKLFELSAGLLFDFPRHHHSRRHTRYHVAVVEVGNLTAMMTFCFLLTGILNENLVIDY